MCKFRFILAMIKTDNKKIDITKYLHNDNKSYYLENSILFDKNFNNWLCINYLNEVLDNIKICLIDHNANEIELNSSQFIKLGINNYHIGSIKLDKNDIKKILQTYIMDTMVEQIDNCSISKSKLLDTWTLWAHLPQRYKLEFR